MNNVTKRGTVDGRNGGAPYAFWIAIVPVPDTTPEIFRSIEPRALITRRSVRERLQGFSSGSGGGGGGDRTVEISRCFDSRGSFRLFQQQPPGCRYHRNFPLRSRPPRCNQFRHRITLPRLSRRLQRSPDDESEIGSFRDSEAPVDSLDSVIADREVVIQLRRSRGVI